MVAQAYVLSELPPPVETMSLVVKDQKMFIPSPLTYVQICKFAQKSVCVGTWGLFKNSSSGGPALVSVSVKPAAALASSFLASVSLTGQNLVTARSVCVRGGRRMGLEK